MMAESTRNSTDSADGGSPWQWRHVGLLDTLHVARCQRLYSAEGKKHDLALFYTKGQFYVMEAWCTHMGGPLYQGDIEDYKGSEHIMCPWHGYMFDLKTGKNDIGLQKLRSAEKIEAQWRNWTLNEVL